LKEQATKIKLNPIQTNFDTQQQLSTDTESLIITKDTPFNQGEPKVDFLDYTKKISQQETDISKLITSEHAEIDSILPENKAENKESTQKEDALNFKLPSFTLDMSDLFEFF
jgi:hypothetical protein